MTEQALFLAALDIPDPGARAAFLADACAGNDPLRQQVEALLAAHDRSGEFLDRPALEQIARPPAAEEHTRTVVGAAPAGPDEPTQTGPTPPPAGPDDLGFLGPPTRAGSLGRLAHYEVLERVGRGGFGTVLKAFDDRLHRVVAIKVLAPQLATSGTARARFLREARSGAAVRDEHVIHIYAVSGDDEPVPYLVMEYVAGQTLQQKLDKAGPLPVREVLRIGQQVARGLAAAHATGLIHRDVKPGNILLENGVERVKLTDFGLARAADDASISHSGVVAGTPMYMAPEQALGEAIDHRADLFSLGSVLYAMCTGRPPFRASTTMAVLKRVCEEEARPVREVNPEVPAWLGDVIARLHAKKPADRFQGAREVADLLGRYLAELQTHGAVTPVETGRAEPRQRPDDDKIGGRTPHRSPWRKRLAWGAALFVLLGAALVAADRADLVYLFHPRDPNITLEVDEPNVMIRIYAGSPDEEQPASWEERAGGVVGDPVRLIHFDRTAPETLSLPAGTYWFVAELDGKVFHFERVRVDRYRWVKIRWAAEVVRKEKEKLRGPWRAVRGERDGRPLAPDVVSQVDFRLDFHDDVVRVRLQQTAETRLTDREGAYELDPRKKPATLDLTDAYDGRTLLAVYRWVGDALHICFSSRERPADFTTRPKSDRLLFVLERDRAPAEPDTAAEVGPDPGSLAMFGQMTGKSFRFRVIGSTNGPVYGTDVYTTDSLLAGAAVHAGLLKPGQQGTVRVTILPARLQYPSVPRNGITPVAWGPYPSSFRFDGATDLSDPRRPVFTGSVSEYRGEVGKVFVTEVVGRQGAVWGTGTYTDDSDLGAAAVHAALLKVGQIGPVRVTILAGLDKYTGSAKNGITSADYAAFPGSFQVAAGSIPDPVQAPFDVAQAKASQKAWAEYLGMKDEVERVNTLGMRMVLIPPGTTPVGSSPEEVDRVLATAPDLKDAPDWLKEFVRAESPVREATVADPYRLGAHEVTVRQFREFVTATGHKTEAETKGGGFAWNDEAKKLEQRPEYVWSNPQFSPTDGHPVVFVSRKDAQAFCDWLSQKEARQYVIPTEAQWEHACRAGTTTRWWFGDDRERMKAHGWTLADSGGENKEVGRLAANPFGLFDVYGNACELTVSPTGEAVERGGSAGVSPERSRSATRYPVERMFDTGFRRGFRVAEVGDLTGRTGADGKKKTWLDALKSNLWTPGSTVTIGFVEEKRPAEAEAAVRAAVTEWGKYANLNFQYVPDAAQAMIRVTFVRERTGQPLPPDLKAGSLLGTTARNVKRWPAWSFFLSPTDPRAELDAHALHEFGHALGLLHEQDRVPKAWNVGWRTAPTGTPLDKYDPASVMVMPKEGPKVPEAERVKANRVLSVQDKVLISTLYPGRWTPTEVVNPPDIHFVVPGRAGKPDQAFNTAAEAVATAAEDDAVAVRGLPADPAHERVRTLRQQLIDLQRQNHGKRQALVAAKLLAQLAWPVDAWRRDMVRAEQLAAIGFKDATKAPAEVVGIIQEPQPVGRRVEWGTVPFAVFSPDGRTLAYTAGQDIVLWDIEKGVAGHRLKGHKWWVTGIAFSPDGKTLASCSVDQTIKLWDAGTGVESPVLTGHEQPVWCVAFSPDGKLLASGGGDNAAVVHVWDVEQRKSIHRLNDPDDTFIKGVAFSPDGKTLATTGAVKTVKLWELPGAKLLHTLKADRLGWDDGYHVKETAVAWHPNGKTVASPAKYPTLRIWEAAKGQELRTLTDADQVPSGVAWSPDGSVLAAVGHDHLTLRDGNTGASRGSIPVGGMAVAWAPDGRHVAVARKEGMGRGTAALGDVAVVVLRLKDLKAPAPPK